MEHKHPSQKRVVGGKNRADSCRWQLPGKFEKWCVYCGFELLRQRGPLFRNLKNIWLVLQKEISFKLGRGVNIRSLTLVEALIIVYGILCMISVSSDFILGISIVALAQSYILHICVPPGDNVAMIDCRCFNALHKLRSIEVLLLIGAFIKGAQEGIVDHVLEFVEECLVGGHCGHWLFN